MELVKRMNYPARRYMKAQQKKNMDNIFVENYTKFCSENFNRFFIRHTTTIPVIMSLVLSVRR